MSNKDNRSIKDFWVVGINYKKTDATVRGQFAINNDQYANILTLAPAYGVQELFILSTCNRTEIYGLAEKPEQLIGLLAAEAPGKEQTLSEIAYIKSGNEAVTHLFEVSAGLDSQILGDYEILGQIKTAAKFSKQQGFVGAFMERIINSVLQASKAVKTHTSLSGGTVSVSFAAIQYIKEKIADLSGKKILLLGTGKIGRNTCKNLVDYLGIHSITLINRTEEKARELADSLGLTAKPYTALNEEVQAADIILVATNAEEPTIFKAQLAGAGDKLIIDLSIPCNVEAGAQDLPNITLINVDELSKIKDETLQKREAEVPKAKAIIQEHIAEFLEWCAMRKHVPMLKEVKNKLQQLDTIHTTHIPEPASQEKIQKVINTLAIKMRQKNTVGCHYIEAINEFMEQG